MTNNKISFAIENVEMIDTNKNSNFAVLSLDFFASGPNLHDMYVSENTLMRTANTIKNCPIVWAYDDKLDDIYTHTPDEVPCGFVPETSTITSRLLEDGRTMLSVVAYVWKRYTGELLSFFKRDGGKKPVSVEMVVYNTRQLPNNKLELTDFRYEGITILGSFVTPAIPLAQASVISFAEIKNEYMEDLENEFPTRYIDMGTSKWTDKSAILKEKESIDMGKEIAEEILGLSQPETEEKVMEEEVVEQVEMAEAKEEEKVEELSAPEQPVIEETMAKEEEEDKEDDKEDKEDEEETFEQPVAEDMSAKVSELTETIERMSAELESYKTENDELKKFKANIEESQKAFAVEQTIRELEEKVIIPEEQKSEMLAESEKYSYSDIEAWKTLCKAKSFDFVARESKDSNVVKKAALPFGNVSAKSKNDLWQ